MFPVSIIIRSHTSGTTVVVSRRGRYYLILCVPVHKNDKFALFRINSGNESILGYFHARNIKI